MVISCMYLTDSSHGVFLPAANIKGATYHWHAAAFNILYVGIKEWRIASPIYRGWTGMGALQAAKQLNEHYTLQCVSDLCTEY